MELLTSWLLDHESNLDFGYPLNLFSFTKTANPDLTAPFRQSRLDTTAFHVEGHSEAQRGTGLDEQASWDSTPPLRQQGTTGSNKRNKLSFLFVVSWY